MTCTERKGRLFKRGHVFASLFATSFFRGRSVRRLEQNGCDLFGLAVATMKGLQAPPVRCSFLLGMQRSFFLSAPTYRLSLKLAAGAFLARSVDPVQIRCHVLPVPLYNIRI
jgi:hypothetical protein